MQLVHWVCYCIWYLYSWEMPVCTYIPHQLKGQCNSRHVAMYILLKPVEFALNKMLISAVKIVYISVDLYCTQTDLNFGVTSFGTRCIVKCTGQSLENRTKWR